MFTKVFQDYLRLFHILLIKAFDENNEFNQFSLNPHSVWNVFIDFFGSAPASHNTNKRKTQAWLHVLFCGWTRPLMLLTGRVRLESKG